MSLVSNGSLNENTTPYIGIFSRSGLLPNALSSSAARSSASGCWRKNSHTGGAPGGSGPERRMLVELAPAGDRALAADVERAERVELAGVRECRRSCRTAAARSGSEAVASMRPNSSGGPLYLSRSGRMVEAFTVCVGNFSARAGAHHAGRLGNRRAVLRHQHAGDAVVGAHAGEIVLHHRDHGGLRPTGSPRAGRRSSPLRDGNAWVFARSCPACDAFHRMAQHARCHHPRKRMIQYSQTSSRDYSDTRPMRA